MSHATVPLPHPLVRCVGEVAAAIDRVVDVDPLYLSTPDKREVLLELSRQGERLAGLRLRALTAADDVARDAGARSASAWLAHETRTDGGVALRDAKLARALETTYEPTRSAVLRGRVNLAQARVIVEALDELPGRLPSGLRLEAEERLLEYAAEHDPQGLRILGRRILEIIAPEVAEEHERRKLEEEERRARRKARISFRNLGGGMTRAVVDVPDATAAIFKTCLHAYTSPRRDHLAADAAGADGGASRIDPDTGERIPHAELLGQAFCALVEHIPVDRLPRQGGSPVSIVATIDQEWLTGRLGAAGLSTGGRLSVGELRRLACNHQILPAVLDGASRVLDLGRSQRLFTAAQRRALELLHETCQARGCTIPAAWCEAHHRVPFGTGGRTDLADGALLCPFHHHRAHDGAHDQTWLPDGSVRFHRRS